MGLFVIVLGMCEGPSSAQEGGGIVKKYQQRR